MPRRAQIALGYLQAPVDTILGAASHVRILRVLTESAHPIPPAAVARESRLDLSGVLRAIESLAETGIVQSIGVGRGRVIQFNTAHYLAPVLKQLFDTERQRRQDLIDKLQRAMQAVSPTPRAAWIEGPHAVGHDTAQDALRVCVLVHVRDRHSAAEALGERLRKIERKFGLTIELVLRTMADLASLTPEQTESLKTALPLHGVPPIHIVEPGAPGSPGPQTHAELDGASRKSAEGIAQAIKRDPRVIERAQRWIEQRLPNASEGERHELREWAHILSMPARQVAALLVDPGERATRLRQSSPFRSSEPR